MRRFAFFVIFVLSSIPVGLSIVGCKAKIVTVYCDGGDSGLAVGQMQTITMGPQIYGISLNFGETGQLGAPSGTDCKGNTVSAPGGFTYGSTNPNVADVSNTGAICAGTWNRNLPNGVPDYSICTPPTAAALAALAEYEQANPGMPAAYYTASFATVVSNPVSFYSHPVLNSIVLNPIPPPPTGVSFCYSQGTSVATPLTGIAYSVAPIAVLPSAISAATASAGATSNLIFLTKTGTLSGTFTVFFGQGIYSTPKSLVIPGGTTLAGAATLINANSANLNQVTAVAASDGITMKLTGPVPAASDVGQELSFNGSNLNIVPNDITSVLGHISYQPLSSTVLTIDPNGYITAQAPGSTIITADVSDASSSAVLFSTCPPQTITISVPGSCTPNKLPLTPNLPISLTATATDANGVNLTGLTLEWESTNPRTISVSNGQVAATYPGSAAITAICQQPLCNPAPLAYLGVNDNGNGKPITSNAIEATASGTNSTVLYMASSQSRYFNTMDFTTGLIGTPLQLPYIPNSMQISQDGTNIFMGNTEELMVMSSAGALTKQDPTAPGTVIAVSPDSGTVIISDYVRNLIYLYNTNTFSVGSSFGGTVIAAHFSADSQTVYMIGGNAQGVPNNKFYVYSQYSGFHDISSSVAANGANDVVATVPGVGAYVAGTIATAGFSYCPVGSGSSAAFYPQSSGPIVPARIDRITATNDGVHILGATVTPTATLSDIDVSLPSEGTNPQYCPYNNTAPAFGNTLVNQVALGVPATAITGVVPATNSAVAFVTYTSTAGSNLLPAYKPAASGAGMLSNVTLSGAVTAPVTGAYSNDDTTFYVGTTGDNLVHIVNTQTLTDTGTINPVLPSSTGTGYATPNFVVTRPRSLN